MEGLLWLPKVSSQHFKSEIHGAMHGAAEKNLPIILCLGESTTAWAISEAYPAFLQTKIDAYFGAGKYRVVNAGITGTDTEEILKNLDKNIQIYSPKIVVSMMGINDWWNLQDQNVFYRDLKTYKFLKLLITNIKYWAGSTSKAIKVVKKRNDVIDADKIELPEHLDVQTAVNSALKAYNENRFIDSIEYFKSLENEKNLPPHFHYWLARSYFSAGQKKISMRHFRLYEESKNEAEAYLHLAQFFLDNSAQLDNQNLLIAEKYLNKAYQKAPDNADILTALGVWHLKNKSAEKAKAYFEKSVATQKAGVLALLLLGRHYVAESDLQNALEIFKLGLSDETETGVLIWGDFLETLVKNKDFDEAAKYFALAQERYADHKMFRNRMARLRIPGVHDEPWDQMAAITRFTSFLLYPPTRRNYRALADTLRSKGILHLAMQYPLRDAAELREILYDYPETVVIDNLENFQSELEIRSYNELFVDRFAKDFGHLTPRGAELVAEQVFKALLKKNALGQNF